MKDERTGTNKSLKNISDEKLMDVCREFMAGNGPKQVAAACTERWKSQGSDYKITREDVYKLIMIARERRFFRLSPPIEESLSNRVAERFNHETSDIKVVNVRHDLDHLASAAADIVFKQIQILGRRKQASTRPRKTPPRVHVGLGAGRTTLLFSKHLAAILRSESEVPPLVFHALTSGFDVDEPIKGPGSFFTYFENLGHDISYVGLFAPPLVRPKDYEARKKEPIVRRAFERASEIDIVVTALASVDDKHGDLRRLTKLAGSGATALLKRGVVADVLYRSYSNDGPINITSGWTNFTLFDLDELRLHAEKRDKYVVLISGPCGQCRQTRTKALRPLLKTPALKVWTQVVMDLTTAEELLAAGAG